jgi:putative ABC transport system permease protein
MTTTDTLVEIRDLRKAYRRGDQDVPVLLGITLNIKRGDYIALMGPSGSGKSTLLNLIAGIDKPSSGILRIDGEDITSFNEADLADWRATNVGFIFQFYNLMPVLTAFENVELPLMLTNLSRGERKERTKLALSMVGLGDRMTHYPNELSGGQQQRVAIARALISDPTLIVADEPTGDLDKKSAEDVLALLRRLNEELGKTIIMVTHDSHAAKVCQHEPLNSSHMFYLKLIFKNIFRSKLRALLTIIGMVVAIVAFGMLRTVVDSWYAASNMASANRLITRNSISLVFPLPIYYKERLRAVDGIEKISYSNWFGGIYKDPSNFFPQFAVDHNTYFDLYPEFLVKPDELAAWKSDRRGVLVGRNLADSYGFKVGDTIPLQGTIFPGNWQFTVRGIYEPAEPETVTRQLYFHWDYLNEEIKKRSPRRGEQIGVFILTIKDASRAAEISQMIDKEFSNSLAETLSETEKAFQLGFIAQSEAIIVAIRIVSFVVIIIIFAVVANTIAMTARERMSEYATLKALGFGPAFVFALVIGEGLMMCLIGGGIGALLTIPAAAGFKVLSGGFLAVFRVSAETSQYQLLAAFCVGLLAALIPAIQSARVRIIDGLRHVA